MISGTQKAPGYSASRVRPLRSPPLRDRPLKPDIDRGFKRARRNVPCINHITSLPDFDLGIGLRKTAQHWRVALQTVRQNLVVRRKLEAAQSNAIPPDAIACEAVPQREMAAPGSDIAFGVCGDRAPFRPAFQRRFAQAGIVPKPPRAHIDPASEAQKQVLMMAAFLAMRIRCA